MFKLYLIWVLTSGQQMYSEVDSFKSKNECFEVASQLHPIQPKNGVAFLSCTVKG